MQVQVYWNVRRKVFSVVHRGRVVAHRDAIVLTGVRFTVNHNARRRIAAGGPKEVHAFVCGEWIGSDDPRCRPAIDSSDVGVTYNPRRDAGWITREGQQPIYQAPHAVLGTVTTPEMKRPSVAVGY